MSYEPNLTTIKKHQAAQTEKRRKRDLFYNDIFNVIIKIIGNDWEF